MFGLQKIIIAEHERGLLFKNGNLQDALKAGIYRFFSLHNRIRVEVFDLMTPEFNHKLIDFIVKEKPQLVEQYFQVVNLSDHQVGLVYKDGNLASVLPPGTRQVYWRGPVDVRVEPIDIKETFVVEKQLATVLSHARVARMANVSGYIHPTEVADKHLGLLFVDGEFVKTLQPGLHAFWKFNRNISVEQVDLRVQANEVSGQEILTKDKVSLRVNLAAVYKILDPVKARQTLKNFNDFLYRELQFGLRQAIGTRTLDTLLGEKGELDHAIFDAVRDKAAAHGIEVQSVGVKDIILPGDMKEILNQVVEVEKASQANVIKRREETAATRALLNTARLMDENPTLLRLKELETLEKITDKVDKLTVFGGLEGVLKDTVKINV